MKLLSSNDVSAISGGENLTIVANISDEMFLWVNAMVKAINLRTINNPYQFLNYMKIADSLGVQFGGASITSVTHQ